MAVVVLRGISARVEQQATATQEIARNAAQVSQSTGAVSRRTADVSSAAEETCLAADGVPDSSAVLSGQAVAFRQKPDALLRAVQAAREARGTGAFLGRKRLRHGAGLPIVKLMIARVRMSGLTSGSAALAARALSGLLLRLSRPWA